MSLKVGLVIAKYHREITSKMEKRAVEAAENHDAEVKEKMEVPGSFDIPLAAKRMASDDDIDAVTVIGAIVEGDTDHDKIIGHSTAKTLQEISLDTDKPVTMAITGPGMTAEEASQRIDYAYSAVEGAIDMAKNL